MKKILFFCFAGILIFFLGYSAANSERFFPLLGSKPIPIPTPTLNFVFTPTPTSEQNIQVLSPHPNEEIGIPLFVVGKARVFENQLNVRLKDATGKVLVQELITAQSSQGNAFGSFTKAIDYPKPTTPNGVLEVYDLSSKDGTEIDKVSIPIKFEDVVSSTLTVYFGFSKNGESAANCNVVFPVTRKIPKAEAVARGALEELLKGPTLEEREQGFFSSINPGVVIQKLTIENGTAKVDFDETLEKGVGGSCKVAAIRAQITETLKQFSAVKKVLISINGKTEDILQP